LGRGDFPGHGTGVGSDCSLNPPNQPGFGALTNSTTLGSTLGRRGGWFGHSGGFHPGHGTAILTLN
jgi:hypothetical protein